MPRVKNKILNAPSMYHCHILEHEDGGIMRQFVVK
jgi:FtsP/CotA-like multicopper oxidase with cupredoxin domain